MSEVNVVGWLCKLGGSWKDDRPTASTSHPLSTPQWSCAGCLQPTAKPAFVAPVLEELWECVEVSWSKLQSERLWRGNLTLCIKAFHPQDDTLTAQFFSGSACDLENRKPSTLLIKTLLPLTLVLFNKYLAFVLTAYRTVLWGLYPTKHIYSILLQFIPNLFGKKS